MKQNWSRILHMAFGHLHGFCNTICMYVRINVSITLILCWHYDSITFALRLQLFQSQTVSIIAKLWWSFDKQWHQSLLLFHYPLASSRETLLLPPLSNTWQQVCQSRIKRPRIKRSSGCAPHQDALFWATKTWASLKASAANAVSNTFGSRTGRNSMAASASRSFRVWEISVRDLSIVATQRDQSFPGSVLGQNGCHV